MPTPFVVVLLALLLGTQPIVTDVYLPALPMLTQDLGASMAQAQLTLSGLLLAFGLSQLVWGPLSDRFGRRPILMLGLGAYVLCGAAAALADSMASLIVWRTAQGAAMGAAVMCARAMVRDLYTPFEGARAMSRSLTGIGIIAFVSPTAGSLIAEHFGWRVALMVPALFGAVTLALVVLRMRETAPAAQPRALHPRELARTWLRIVRHPKFIAFSTLTIATYGALFTLLAASSFVYIQVLGLSRTQYGLLMSGTALVYISGTVICRRLLPRFGVRRSVMLAAGVSLLGGMLAAVPALMGVQSIWSIAPAVFLIMMAHGVHQPCGQSGTTAPFPEAAGAASAMNGFLMMAAAFAMGGWLGARMDGTVLPLTNGLGFWTVCIALSAWILVRKHGDTADR